MLTFELLTPDAPLVISGSPEIVAAAAFVLGDGNATLDVRPPAPALTTATVNTILRDRREELAAALESVAPADVAIGATARRLARRLRVVSHA